MDNYRPGRIYVASPNSPHHPTLASSEPHAVPIELEVKSTQRHGIAVEYVMLLSIGTITVVASMDDGLSKNWSVAKQQGKRSSGHMM